MKILIVDDSTTMLMTLELILNELDYHDVLKASVPQDAIDIALNTPLDLILLDWNMPEKEGIEVLRILKSDELTRHIPVIMITVEGATDKIKEAIDSGAEGYLLKPVRKEALKIRLGDIESANLLGLKQ